MAGKKQLKKKRSKKAIAISVFYSLIGIWGVLYAEWDMLQGLEEQEQIVAVIGISFMFLLGAITKWGLVPCVAIVAIVIGYPFLSGVVPGDGETILLLVYLFGILTVRRVEKEAIKTRMGVAAMGVAVAASLLGAVFLTPVFQKYFSNTDRFESKIREIVTDAYNSELFGNGENGGVGDGRLRKISRFTGGKKTQLEIETGKVYGDLYLQGYIGGDYENNRWHKADERAFRAWSAREGISGAEVKNQLSGTVESMNQILSSTQVSEQQMKVKNMAANSDYMYVPYGTIYSDRYDILADTYAKGKGVQYEISYYPAIYFESSAWNFGSGFSGTDNQMVKYEEYVKETYLQVPESFRKRFRVEAGRLSSSDLPLLIEEIKELLHSNTRYSRNPGRVPIGSDFCEYFFYENKKGFCTHYASTATLLFRMKGIPARFVSGYHISSNDNKIRENGDGSLTITVTGDNAHAWTEIYESGVGWHPIEVTPNTADSFHAESDRMLQEEGEKPQENPEDEVREDSADDSVENVPDGEPQPDEENIGERRNSISVIIIGVSCVTVAILIFMVGRFVYMHKRRFGYAGNCVNKKIRHMMYNMYELLEFSGGKSADVWEKDAFAKWAGDICKNVQASEWERVALIAEQAHYSNERLGREEYAFICNIYNKSKNEIYEKGKVKRKLVFKCWKRF